MRTKLLKFLYIWLPPLIWASVVFSFSSYSTPTTTEIYWGDFVVKKTAHIIEYAILTILLYRSFKLTGYSRKMSGYLAISISAIYGFTDEFHQSFTPGREPHLRDVIFDTIGAALAIYIVWNLLPKAPKKLKDLAENWQIS